MIRRHLALGMVLAALLAAGVWAAPKPAPKPAPTKSLAILVVGDASSEELSAREKLVFRALQEWRARAKLTRKSLPIISYHMDKDEERTYCESKLGIKPGNLLFVGVVEHRSLVAQKVRFRLNNVTRVDVAARDAMSHVLLALGHSVSILEQGTTPASPTPGESPSPTVTPTVTPTARPTPTTTPTVSLPKVRGVSVLRVVTVDYDGNPRSRFTIDDRGVYVNVYLRNELPGEEQRHLLSVRCIDPQGRPYGRVMGGPFSLASGERVDGVDMVRRSDPERHNGFLIKGNQIASTPGTYQIVVEVDGQILGHGSFEIAPRTE